MISNSQMAENDDSGLNRRLQRNTMIIIVISLAAAAIIAGARMAGGVLVGGILSLFNKRWLEASVRVLLDQSAETQSGKVPSFTAAKLILRYFVIIIVIGLAVWSRWINPLGVAIGFASFVLGAMVEAAYQFILSFKSNPDLPGK